MNRKHGWRQAIIIGSKNSMVANAYCPACGTHFEARGLALAAGGRAVCNGEEQRTETFAEVEAWEAKMAFIHDTLKDLWSTLPIPWDTTGWPEKPQDGRQGTER